MRRRLARPRGQPPGRYNGGEPEPIGTAEPLGGEPWRLDRADTPSHPGQVALPSGYEPPRPTEAAVANVQEPQPPGAARQPTPRPHERAGARRVPGDNPTRGAIDQLSTQTLTRPGSAAPSAGQLPQPLRRRPQLADRRATAPRELEERLETATRREREGRLHGTASAAELADLTRETDRLARALEAAQIPLRLAAAH